MTDQTTIAVAAVVSALATIAIGITGGLYTAFTRRLWRDTRRLAETAARQAETAQRMLDAAHRPWLSVALYHDVGTSPDVINMASVFTNHGNVPATLTGATLGAAWEGKTWAEGDQLKPKGDPSQLCIFPGQRGELTWGFSNVSFAPWPKSGFFRISIAVIYRGAFERTYKTRLEVSYPRPETNVSVRSTRPMNVVRAEAT